jgi:hypothetical protein
MGEPARSFEEPPRSAFGRMRASCLYQPSCLLWTVAVAQSRLRKPGHAPCDGHRRGWRRRGRARRTAGDQTAWGFADPALRKASVSTPGLCATATMGSGSGQSSYISTAKIRHVPGMPLRSCSPRSLSVWAGADAEVADRAADEHLARSGEAADPCADVDREAADVVVGRNDLAPTRCHARPSTNDRVRQFAFPPGANRACHSYLALS